MQSIIQMANSSPQIVKQRGMKIGHLVILNAVQDIEDLQGKG